MIKAHIAGVVGLIALNCGSAFAQIVTAPRIVNLYNFCRNSDYRVPDSEKVLFDTTAKQVEIIHAHHLHGTWALQYDALINPDYQKLFKEELTSQDEIGAWWEIPRQLAEKAGLKWRGAHDWDSTANIGFSPGYTPDERRKLVDVYMADFKTIFGKYPATVGSWYIDEVTLAYMADHYGVVASCNCKDQIGTDGYTLWGGYWNQAYYPSKVNAYMPAQDKPHQINIPIFRMLGSDPIYQYGNPGGIFSLEPVYPRAGGSAKWVDWFFDSLVSQPCLAFGYTQAGQENSFGWEAMKKGLGYQLDSLEKLSNDGKVRIETLEKSGEWFKSQFKETPATSVVCLTDWRDRNHASVWYDSRFYRINFFWDENGLSIRDLHRFDHSIVSSTHDSPLQARSLSYETLPIVDSALWGTREHSGDAVLRTGNGISSLTINGEPKVTESDQRVLLISQPLKDGATLEIRCGERDVEFIAKDVSGQPIAWELSLEGGEMQTHAIVKVLPDHIQFKSAQSLYELKITSGGCDQKADGSVLLRAGAGGKLALLLGD